MTETDARNVLLLRAFETAPAGQATWSADDRAWASRAAAEVEGEAADSETFIARRATLALERLSKRDSSVRRAVRLSTWRPWIGWGLGFIALAAGLLTDAIGPAQRVNVLAPPLLALMAWNLFVYLAIGLRSIARVLGRKPRIGRIGALLVRSAHVTSKASPADSPAIGRFSADWARTSARLNSTRVARVLHVAAILFALGALAGMYVRGLVLEYRAGWESTFLDVDSLQALLGFVLGPASMLTGIELPDAIRLEAMRFPQSDGERAAPWIHLYAVTVALVVVVPRALLALFDRAIERRLVHRFPLALDDAYFAALAREHSGEAATVAVIPCNHALSPQATLTLQAVLGAVLGSSVRLSVATPVAYGDEESAASRIDTNTPTALAIGLFTSSATPEPESHGVFVDRLAGALPAETPLLVLVDESAFMARFGGSDATAVRRRDERRGAWKRLLAARERQPLFIDLEHADASAAARKVRDALDRALDRRTHPVLIQEAP